MQNIFVSKPRLKYFVSGSLANIIWAFIAIPLKTLSLWPSDTILYFRIFISCIFVWLFLFLFRFTKWRKDWIGVNNMGFKERNRLYVFILLSTLLIMGNWFTFIYSVNNISIKSAAFAYLICPLITTLGGFFILKEKLSKIKWLSLFIAFISVIILANTSIIEVAWSIVIASFYAFYLIIQRILKDIDKFNFLAIQLLLCAFCTFPLFYSDYVSLTLTFEFWFLMILIAVIFTIIPLFLSMYSLNGLTSATSGILIYINPIISFAIAILYFGEIVTVSQILAYILIVLAIILYNANILNEFFSKFVKSRTF